MKANFSLTERFVPSFMDNATLLVNEQLIAVITMPDVQDVFAILDRLQAAGLKGEKDAKVTMEQATKIAAEAGQYVPKYVALENAEDFKIEDVVKYAPFFPLAAELLLEIVRFGQPSEDDAKN